MSDGGLVLGVIAAAVVGLWWRNRRKQASAKALPDMPPAASPQPPPTPVQTPQLVPVRLSSPRPLKPEPVQMPEAARRPQAASASSSQPARWFAKGQSVTIAGHIIADGMVHAGTPPKGASSWTVEKCLIDPSLSVASANPDTAGDSLNYWPSYSSIEPQARLAYLRWLASGRSDPAIGIGYVFLYFYGLEQRLFRDKALSEAPMLVAEVERLRGLYGHNRPFARYSDAFLDAALLLQGPEGWESLTPPLDPETGGAWPRVALAIGRRLAAGEKIPADWMLAWWLHHPDARLRVPQRRVFTELCVLFRLRFAASHRDGMKIAAPKSRLKHLYAAASSDFTAELDGEFRSIPDISRLTAPLDKARDIVEACCAELEAYGRFLTKRPEDHDSLQALALLPPDLLTVCDPEALRMLRAELTADKGMRIEDLLRRLGLALPDSGKLGKAGHRQAAEMLEQFGLGLEPDARLGGRTPKPGEAVVVFALADRAGADACGPAYASAALVIGLSSLVIHSDSQVMPEEEKHLLQLVEDALHLSSAERRRLEAHARWLIAAPPQLSHYQAKLTGLEAGQREELARFVIAVAAADGHISAEEIRLLEKMYRLLGLEESRLYRDIHALQSGGRDEPVTILEAEPGAPDHPIPRPPSARKGDTAPAGGFDLDMAQLQRIRADTAQVSRLLADIFTEEDEAEAEPPPLAAEDGPASLFDGLDAAHGTLLEALLDQGELPYADYERLCRDHGLMPGGALECLNDWALDRFDDLLVEDGDPVVIQVSLVPVDLRSPCPS